MDKLSEFLRKKYPNQLKHDFDISEGWEACKKEIIKICEHEIDYGDGSLTTVTEKIRNL